LSTKEQYLFLITPQEEARSPQDRESVLQTPISFHLFIVLTKREKKGRAELLGNNLLKEPDLMESTDMRTSVGHKLTLLSLRSVIVYELKSERRMRK